MRIGRPFPDLLAPLGCAVSPEEGFSRVIKQLVAVTRATAGGACFAPGRGMPLVTTAGARPGSPLDRWLRARLGDPPPRCQGLEGGTDLPAGRRARPLAMFRSPLGKPATPVGQLILLGSSGRRGLDTGLVPPGISRQLGHAMERIWGLHQRALRLQVINDVSSLMATTLPLESIYESAAAAVARVIRLDAVWISLLDRERGEVRLLELAARPTRSEVRALRVPMSGTLADWVAAHRTSRRIDDAEDPSLPPMSRELLARYQLRSAILAPLVSRGEVIGTFNVAHREPRAFTDGDVEVLMEVARPLASAIWHSRLHDEIVLRAEELAALNRTSQLITARLDLGSLLDAVSRSVTGLVASTGCGIGLFNADRTAIDHVAAHGFRTAEWRGLSVPVGEGIIGRAAATGEAIRSDDLATDPRAIHRDVDAKEGISSMLSVPLRVAGEVIGVISAFSGTPAFFTARHQGLLESFADQAGIAIQNARLFEESQRRTRETEALLEAVRAVNQSLEVGETIRLILNQARAVLGVQSCSVFTLDPDTGELAAVASLDLDMTRSQIRIQIGEGITGAAVQERRPVQSADLHSDPRVRYRRLSAGGGFRSMLAAPLLVADEAIGALTVLRRDVHHFTPEEESLVSAFADQAAMALEHARLFSSVRTYSEQLEAMVTARTHELDAEKRFVEVVLETLPLGLFVLDGELRVVSANREGAGLLSVAEGGRTSFPDLFPAAKASPVRSFLEALLAEGSVRQLEEEVPGGAEPRTLRLTGARLRAPGGERTHAVVLVEDISPQKRLERQMLLTERLTTAGRLAAGVAHELNNPLATIAGCAEALRERAQNPELSELSGFKDFPGYLSLIEEEAYRCKEITGSLLQFVREPGSRRAPVDVNALVGKALELLGHQPRFSESELRTDLDPTLPLIVGNEGQLRQVFLGLSANGLEAMGGRGALDVLTRRREDDVEISFVDHGPGIPPDIAARIFDPFFTTKPPGQGTGLGLAIAQGIVADHGGRIEVDTRPGAGAVFRVVLPVAPPAARPAS
ncbi:MAG TPA: GAF domain-containing protein [Candidatus Methylomirabilis sp.]|nr:GAF domain-containing protein [Candidatus Methylomirabilis sp.]